VSSWSRVGWTLPFNLPYLISNACHSPASSTYLMVIYDKVPWTNMFIFDATAPQWARASSFTRFLDHTQRRTSVSRTPLDEWSARRRDLYLTTHNTHNRQTSMLPGGIRTHSLSGRSAADLRLTSRCHWDRCCSSKSILSQNSFGTTDLNHEIIHENGRDVPAEIWIQNFSNAIKKLYWTIKLVQLILRLEIRNYF
jgi:hypothetical protein